MWDTGCVALRSRSGPQPTTDTPPAPGPRGVRCPSATPKPITSTPTPGAEPPARTTSNLSAPSTTGSSTGGRRTPTAPGGRADPNTTHHPTPTHHQSRHWAPRRLRRIHHLGNDHPPLPRHAHIPHTPPSKRSYAPPAPPASSDRPPDRRSSVPGHDQPRHECRSPQNWGICHLRRRLSVGKRDQPRHEHRSPQGWNALTTDRGTGKPEKLRPPRTSVRSCPPGQQVGRNPRNRCIGAHPAIIPGLFRVSARGCPHHPALAAAHTTGTEEGTAGQVPARASSIRVPRVSASRRA